MNKRFVLLLIISFLLNDCSVYKDKTIKVEKEINLELPKISEIKKKEISEKSKDVSLGYFWGVSEDIYPYFNNHKFENPVSYERPANNFVLKVDYFFDKKQDVKLKFYKWNYDEKIETPREIFTDKFEEIKKFLSEKIGNPTFVKYEDLEKSNEETVRDDVKWKGENLNAYLFRFKGKGGFDQIRLVLYKD
ncbi:hypothetical protein SD427_03660 [Chryseobacterium sp. JJR-5R]|uniref:hypothetical protein n=1 Tax=Chryseobacterium sp. JJR-5R TaxID=3093923 RepID=UPI002A7475F0|nr:hypothetical protein [Chryseobacterium sp. JJR-5R]WPO83450.1 hypothetical protein SD427_03660 [Chryseobacterium sp. JJR-5R]